MDEAYCFPCGSKDDLEALRLKKRTWRKKIYVSLIVLSCASLLLCPFTSFAALNSHDFSLQYNNWNTASAYASYGSTMKAGTLRNAGIDANGYSSFIMEFPSVPLASGQKVLYTTNYGSNVLYLQDGYHYTIELVLAYKFHKTGAGTSSGDVFTGHDFRFALSAAIQGGSSVGSYYISEPVAAQSSYVDGKYIRLVYDFDITNQGDWPEGIVNDDGFLQFSGWGLVDYTTSLSGNYDVTFYCSKMMVKVYSPDDWQAYIVQNGFDNIHNQVVQGMQEYEESLSGQYDFSGGQDALDNYAQANEDVEALIDTGAVNDSLNIDDTLGNVLTGIKSAGGFVDYLYSNVLTYYGVIPIAVCFSGVALLLGLVKNR